MCLACAALGLPHASLHTGTAGTGEPRGFVAEAAGGDSGGADVLSPAETGPVSATGHALLDALMSATRWTSPTITYSFPSSEVQFDGIPDGIVDYGGDGFDVHRDVALISDAQREAMRLTLEGTSVSSGVVWFGASDFTLLRFAEVNGFGHGAGSPAGDIRATQSSLPPTAWAAYPDQGLADGEAGDIWFGTRGAGTFYDLRNPVLGNYQWFSVMHEVGHALGLKHGHQAFGQFPALPASFDSYEFSIMTYRDYLGQANPDDSTTDPFGFPQSFMMVDILALQRLYGANYTHHAGDTTYSWSPTTGQMSIDGIGQMAPVANYIFLTIWDGGGVDTYDMSNYATGVKIDLKPGKWSITDEAQRANLDAFIDPPHYALGNVYNSLLYRGNEASLIENATGGAGNDVIGGNAVANFLQGNGGADRLSGRAGDDRLDGGVDNDFLAGGDGADTLDGGDGRDTLDGGAGADSLAGGLGRDVYRVDAQDSAFEAADGGYDRVLSEAGWTLGDWFERLTLLGSASVDGRGNGLANRLDGNAGDNLLEGQAGNDKLFGLAGADTLIGGPGADQLDGGAGADTFLYLGIAERGDRILNYVGAEDRIVVSALGFGGGLSAGMDLAATGRYVANATGRADAASGTGQFIWEADAEILWWDRDGLGAAPALRLATLIGATGMGAAEIIVIA